MPMTLKRDVVEAGRSNGQSKPIDLVHLGAQTQGDEALENEVLGIFENQSKLYMKMMTCSDSSTRIRAAHSLKGAARGIGAFDLAMVAESAEHIGFSQYDLLESELNQVLAYITSLKH